LGLKALSEILVTGGAGYIGSHIVDLLCDSNYSVIILDNLSSGYEENLNSKSKFINGDVRSKTDLDSIFSNHKISSIIHMAAFKDVGESEKSPNKYTENNIIGSLNLISSAIKFKVNKFIFSSTAAVYGNPEYTPLDEKHPTLPLNHYGYTKLYVENYLDWISKIKPLNFVSLRYFNAAGYTDKKDLIHYKEKEPKNLLPIIMEVATNIKSGLEIFGNDYNTQDGTCIRDFIHVLDLADAHIKALDYLDGNKSATINLSTGVGYSVLDIVKIVERVIKNRIKYSFSDRREGDPAILISRFDRARSELKWTPQYSIEEIISSMWDIYNK